MYKTWVCSCYSVITELWKCDVLQQAISCLLTEISTFTFPEAAIGANIRPICTLARHANAFVHLRGREWGQDGALSPISGCTLAELSSLACTGYTSQLRGEPLCGEHSFPSVSNSKWHLFRAAAVHATSQKTGQRHVLRGSRSVQSKLSLGWQNVFDCFIYFVSRFLFIFAFTVFTFCFDLFFSDLLKVPLKYSYYKICLSIVNITAFKIFWHWLYINIAFTLISPFQFNITVRTYQHECALHAWPCARARLCVLLVPELASVPVCENRLNLAGVLWQFLNERQVCCRKDKGKEALSVHLRGAQLWQMGTV